MYMNVLTVQCTHSQCTLLYACNYTYTAELFIHVCLSFLQQYEFTKTKIPNSTDKKVEFSKKLRKYNISLSQYETAYKQMEIKPLVLQLCIYMYMYIPHAFY